MEPAGEHLAVVERLIVAPAPGLFRPLPASAAVPDGGIVRAGEPVGLVEGHGTSARVCSAFTGSLMGMLVVEGERLKVGQAVAWLRT